ncbi:hypothetical protein [Telmatospirillum siberiense]|uniref:Uncharacterized protein n=1 Tax=Telmatospirillum siberiense TaxID=382514 RepID=A0A2N3PUZ6_9PROT|nr:hypothetical protein [Telmatospirillum siberiense]PKU24231.1 hypothetical protein CWS72_12965 [Telmatospirillum siberiense]
MIEETGITVVHDRERSVTRLTDSRHNQTFELDHDGVTTVDPDQEERRMIRAYSLGGTAGLLGCFGAERIRLCPA